MPGVINETAVDRLLAGIEAGAVPAGIFTDDAALDATVPNWRFSVHGGEAVRHELGRWYADPGQFEDVRRSPLPDGELVEFTLGWEEQGIPHACHQAHILRLVDGLVARDTAFCGGRWPASLLAEMRAAAG
jgi:hypothetical protein